MGLNEPDTRAKLIDPTLVSGTNTATMSSGKPQKNARILIATY